MHSNCIFVISVILMAFSVVLCAPTKDSQEMIDPNVKEFYDQRQNGTENYRIDIKDFAIIITPLETLLNMATMLDPIFLEEFKRNDLRKEQIDVTQNNTESELTTELTTAQEENKISSETKPKRGLKSRIGNLILPLVRRHH